MKKKYFLICIPLFAACSNFGNQFVNQRTSWICSLNTTCISDSAWEEIHSAYSTDNITDSTWKRKAEHFKQQPFPSTVLYFKSGPEELVGVEYYGVRYVYNPKISSRVLDGLEQPGLSVSEKIRIGIRIQKLLMEYQCEEGRKESLQFIKEGLNVKE